MSRDLTRRHAIPSSRRQGAMIDHLHGRGPPKVITNHRRRLIHDQQFRTLKAHARRASGLTNDGPHARMPASQGTVS